MTAKQKSPAANGAKKYQHSHSSNHQASEQDAVALFKQAGPEAHRNLCGFMSLLIKINEREQIVPTKDIDDGGRDE